VKTRLQQLNLYLKFIIKRESRKDIFAACYCSEKIKLTRKESLTSKLAFWSAWCHRENPERGEQRTSNGTFVEKMATPKKKYGFSIRLLASK